MTKKTDDFTQVIEEFNDKVNEMTDDLYHKSLNQGDRYYDALKYLRKYSQMAYGVSENHLSPDAKRIFDIVASMAIHRIYREAESGLINRGDNNENH